MQPKFMGNSGTTEITYSEISCYIMAEIKPFRDQINFFKALKYKTPSSVYLYSMQETMMIQPLMSSSSSKNISTVISQFGKRLLGFIRQRVNNEADAEDILQDVWYQLTTTVDVQPIEQVSSWLFTVARNKITDSYRKKKSDSLESMLLGDEDEGEISFRQIMLDNSNHPESEHLKSLFWKTLQESLQELPEEQRNVFVWNELEDLSFKEISKKTGEKINTLISRKRYAVLYLRERLLTLYNEIINH
jgi:RNA polymerase sigma factor (sigma-70 family)